MEVAWVEYKGDRRSSAQQVLLRGASRAGVTSSGRIIGEKVQSADHVAHYLLPAACCLLWAAVHLLFNVPCCPQRAECCVLIVVCCMTNDHVALLETSSRGLHDHVCTGILLWILLLCVYEICPVCLCMKCTSCFLLPDRYMPTCCAPPCCNVPRMLPDPCSMSFQACVCEDL